MDDDEEVEEAQPPLVNIYGRSQLPNTYTLSTMVIASNIVSFIAPSPQHFTRNGSTRVSRVSFIGSETSAPRVLSGSSGTTVESYVGSLHPNTSGYADGSVHNMGDGIQKWVHKCIHRCIHHQNIGLCFGRVQRRTRFSKRFLF